MTKVWYFFFQTYFPQNSIIRNSRRFSFREMVLIYDCRRFSVCTASFWLHGLVSAARPHFGPHGLVLVCTASFYLAQPRFRT